MATDMRLFQMLKINCIYLPSTQTYLLRAWSWNYKNNLSKIWLNLTLKKVQVHMYIVLWNAVTTRMHINCTQLCIKYAPVPYALGRGHAMLNQQFLDVHKERQEKCWLWSMMSQLNCGSYRLHLHTISFMKLSLLSITRHERQRWSANDPKLLKKCFQWKPRTMNFAKCHPIYFRCTITNKIHVCRS